ncbi:PLASMODESMATA CALLOSE-BINDING PROTEIN 3-like [Cornus florida]|uniref:PLASMODESMATA CALLOSE-BINDING PROTEIN 3-like n=1 Tax=Cornus florida TaxID=4283 RepID=UPI00289ABF1B|nr:PLASMODESMATA CALLOSE-BINDING PROTEIN 3-like [Cornus florida]
MGVFGICLVVFLAMTGHSSATYCVCKDGVSDSLLQKNIDYACGAGADCTPIIQNGACYSPNTVKDHCNYAVNSYYQKKGQAIGSCDFSGTATTSTTAPSGQTTTCVYPSSASSSGTPSTNTSTGTPSGTTTPSTTNSPPSSVFGLGPTTGITSTDNSGSLSLLHQTTNLFCSFALTLLFSGLMFLRV